MSGHHHHHRHHAVDNSRTGHVLVVAIVLNLLFVIVEVVVGWRYNSLGLLSDAGHNMGDVFSLILSFVAYRLSLAHATKSYTYGYRKSTVLVSLINAVVLLVAVGVIVMEGVRKLQHPAEVNGAVVSWTAGLGIVINGATAFMLMRTDKNDLNMRGAFLHMAADTMVSLGVLLSGVAIMLWDVSIIDPIVSLVIAAIILFSTWRLLAGSLRLSMDGVPMGVDVDKVARAITTTEGVSGLHHLHIWAMSTTQTALTAHIVVTDIAHMERVKEEVKARLARLAISHVTLEIETSDSHCEQHCECE